MIEGTAINTELERLLKLKAQLKEAIDKGNKAAFPAWCVVSRKILELGLVNETGNAEASQD